MKIQISIQLLFLSLSSVFCLTEFCLIKVNVENLVDLSKDVLVLINGKHVLNVNKVNKISDNSVEVNIPISSVFRSDGNHSIAVYSVESDLSLVGLKTVFISGDEYKLCVNETNEEIRQKRFSPNGRSIGVQYSVWHGFPANAVFKMQRQGAKVKTIETLVVEGKTIDDYWSHGVNEADSVNGYFQVEPLRG